LANSATNGTESDRYRYSAYGLTIDTDIELPELPTTSANPTVTIRSGHIDGQLKNSVFHGKLVQTNASHTLLLLSRTIGANFRVSHGTEVTVDIIDRSLIPQIRIAILGYCLTALLLQNKRLVLHGNAVRTPKGVIAICGQQQAGKSTLTTSLYKRGYSIVADDLVAIESGHQPYIEPGFPKLKLWADTLNYFSETSSGLNRVLPHIDKFSLPVHDAFHSQKELLNTVYILKPTNKDSISSRNLYGVEKVAAIRSQIRSYLPEQTPHGAQWCLRFCSILASRINIVEIERPIEGNTIQPVTDLVEQDIQTRSEAIRLRR